MMIMMVVESNRKETGIYADEEVKIKDTTDRIILFRCQ